MVWVLLVSCSLSSVHGSAGGPPQCLSLIPSEKISRFGGLGHDPGAGNGEGGGAAEEALEFEVYEQGMFKTELCNKWEKTGECPYGNHCQFAHGIGELRPVIRHPRYKTEVPLSLSLSGQVPLRQGAQEAPQAHRRRGSRGQAPDDRRLQRGLCRRRHDEGGGLLEDELEKFNTFFVQKKEEYIIRQKGM